MVVVETVFNYNGVGRFVATAARQLDFPAVMGFTLFSAALLLTIDLVVDILYAFLDPRVRLG